MTSRSAVPARTRLLLAPLAALLLAGCGGEEAEPAAEAACVPAAAPVATAAAPPPATAEGTSAPTRPVPPRDDRELTTLSPEQAELVARLAEVDRAAVGTDPSGARDPGATPHRAAHRYVPGRQRVLAAEPTEPTEPTQPTESAAPPCSTEAPAGEAPAAH